MKQDHGVRGFEPGQGMQDPARTSYDSMPTAATRSAAVRQRG